MSSTLRRVISYRSGLTALILGIAVIPGPLRGDDGTAAGKNEPLLKPIAEWLARPAMVPNQAQGDVAAFTESRVPRLMLPTKPEDWRRDAEKLREAMLERVVFRGAPASWRTARPKVEWMGEVEIGEGYRIRRLRYEALPGLWVPALLYEPTGTEGKLAVSLHVNGHDPAGKAAPYKQIRCLNLARRGMLALNVEWLGMGQLRGPGNSHGKLNQLDLCGVAGLAPFFLVMQRGLDVLLDHPQADPSRVAVAGLSGGGWQTIYLSALDPRVTLANPVAGYSSFVTRARHHSDLGDSEQTPNDMAVVADYTHLTALRSPRPTLLTYNAKDDCCFAAAHALPPLEAAARPAFALLGAAAHLRQHINQQPGNHNFERDNREAFYRMLADHGFASGGRPFPTEELPCEGLVRSPEALRVELPADNVELHQLALSASRELPRVAAWPRSADGVEPWREERRRALREVTRVEDLRVVAQSLGEATEGPIRAAFWRLRLSDTWSVPVTEVAPVATADIRGTTIVVAQQGRRNVADHVASLVSQGQRVVAIDPLFWGESEVQQRAYLFQLLVATVGGRPVGVQAAQIAAVARWLRDERKLGDTQLWAFGARASVAALVALNLEPAVAGARLHDSLGSLREVLEQDLSYEQAPELFCFGLLEAFDIRALIALAAPRPVTVAAPSERARRELSPVAEWYGKLGSSHSPIE